MNEVNPSKMVELYECMGNLYLAGMSIESVVEKGYEFVLAQGTRSQAEMLLAAKSVHAVAEEFGIDREAQQALADRERHRQFVERKDRENG